MDHGRDYLNSIIIIGPNLKEVGEETGNRDGGCMLCILGHNEEHLMH